ncbi:protein kinase, putative, partial [Trypanosoma cruzi marinkellei]
MLTSSFHNINIVITSLCRCCTVAPMTTQQRRPPFSSCSMWRRWLFMLTVLYVLFVMLISSIWPVDMSTPSSYTSVVRQSYGGWGISVAEAAGTNAALETTTVTFTGWSATEVKMNKTGIFPATVALGRYLVIFGGSAIVPPYTSTSVFLSQYALPTINVLDLTTGRPVLPLMLVHNVSTEASHKGQRHRDPPPPNPPKPVFRVPAQLTFPAVGTKNTVQLGLAAYIVGFCTMIPRNVIVENDKEFHAFLRSVQEVRLYQEEFPPVDDVTMDIRNSSLPEDAMLRFNASCVGSGEDIIYIVGGISLEKMAPLASVSQYNVVTGKFIEAGLLLDYPLVAPGVFEGSSLVFIAGGYRETEEHGLVISRMLTVIDPSLVKTNIGTYGRLWQLNWLSPHIMMYNHTLAVMGATNDRSFDQEEVWPDLMKLYGTVETVPIRFPPLRTNAAVFSVTSKDGVTVYLVGGQIPPPDGTGISFDIFTGKMLVDDGHVVVRIVGFHYISLVEGVLEGVEEAAMEMHPMEKGTDMKGEATFLHGLKAHVREDAAEIEEEKGEEEVVDLHLPRQEDFQDGNIHARFSSDKMPTISPSITPTPPPPPPPPPPTPLPKDLPNNDGNFTVLVNGYQPLWYNFTFNILLSQSLAQACPGILNSSNHMANTDLDKVSSCLLRLSDSPTCNSVLLDIGNLSHVNTKPYVVDFVDPITKNISKKKTMAVGPITLVGSLADGIINLTANGIPYGHPQDSLFSEGSYYHHRRRPRSQPKYDNDTMKTYYEQVFLYVCFSSGAFVLPQCKSGVKETRWDEAKAGRKPCTTAFYKALNAERPFVLSPVMKWVPSTTTTMAPSPLPDNKVSYGIIATLVLFALIVTILLSFGLFYIAQCCGWRNFNKGERRHLLSSNDEDEGDEKRGVGRGADLPAHQKQSLLDGKYKVLHRLGRGSFSVVYLVERVVDGQRFALKYVQCADDVDRQEAMRECEVAYTLQGHPNVIRLVDMFMSYRFDINLHAGRARHQQNSEHPLDSPSGSVMIYVDEDSDIYPVPPQRGAVAAAATPGERYLSLVMAYHEKGDLGKWIRQQKSEPMIPETTIMSIAFQILTVMQFMHHHDPPIVHRDLKPENILLDSDFACGRRWKTRRERNGGAEPLRIVITDFGLSRVMDKTFCETGVGSLPYVAPECWQRHYSTKVDIWATGCILYAACAKRVESDNVKVMFSECGRPDFKKKLIEELTQVYGYSLALAAFIVYLLEPDPVRRPSAEEALRLIRKRRKDAMDVNDTAVMVSLYKDDDDDEDDEDDDKEEEKKEEDKEDVD